MLVKQVGTKTEMVDFKSIRELTDWLDATPTSRVFEERWNGPSSRNPETDFNGMQYDQARECIEHGWSVESEKLTQMLRVSELRAKPRRSKQFGTGVVGYAPIVPLVLAGVPQNMLVRVDKVGRDKVITVNKSISYSCSVATSQIEEESVKALSIIRRLEACGYAVNLNVYFAITASRYNVKDYVWRVRIKNANERLNISKMAFPLVNAAMLRRIFFDVEEKWPGVSSAYKNNYGHVLSDSIVEGFLGRNEVVMPSFISRELTEIKDADELVGQLGKR